MNKTGIKSNFSDVCNQAILDDLELFRYQLLQVLADPPSKSYNSTTFYPRYIHRMCGTDSPKAHFKLVEMARESTNTINGVNITNVIDSCKTEDLQGINFHIDVDKLDKKYYMRFPQALVRLDDKKLNEQKKINQKFAYGDSTCFYIN